MKNSFFAVIVSVMLSVSALASHFDAVPFGPTEHLVTSEARGGEVQLLAGEFIPVIRIGGYGPIISSWKVRMVIEVQEKAYDKVFKLVKQAPAGVVSSHPKVYYFRFDSDNIRYIGRSTSDKGLYELSISDNVIGPSDSFRFEVIMPARLNQTPHIGNPVNGWYGPTFGFEVIR